MKPGPTDTQATAFWRWADPRRHFVAALGWVLFALLLAGALLAGEWAAGIAERYVAARSQEQLAQIAGHAGEVLRARLQVRAVAMRTVAALWSADGDDRDALIARLAWLQSQQPELRWIGALDATGHWLGSTDDASADIDVLADPSWLTQAARRPVIVLKSGQTPDAQDTLVFAVPLQLAGQGQGVLVAQLPWLLLQAEVDDHLRAMRSPHGVQLLLVERTGHVLVGPAALREKAPGFDFSEGGRYVVGRSDVLEQHAGDASLGLPAWRVLVREDSMHALASARQTHRLVLAGVLAVGLLMALAAALVATRLLRRLDALARQAQAVRRGERSDIEIPAGHDEVHVIGAALAALIGQLQDEKRALGQLNDELDTRVKARTARIEQLAEDARRAAVTRERLHLARELHDTLAQSLMALLTELRLIRKLGASWDKGQLGAELAHAEQVAAEGLRQARAAIGQMRDAGVAVRGLGPELDGQLKELVARSGLQVQARIDPAAAELTDERADAVAAIAREVLRNVERHAQATKVSLQLESGTGVGLDGDPSRHWHLTITDDGVGFDPSARHDGHFGLVGLYERAGQMGATLMVESAPGRGCRVQLHFSA